MSTHTMTQQARISSRINPDLKQKGDYILSEVGVKPSQVITMLYKQIVKQGGIPFELRVPNKDTIEALNEDVSKNQSFHSVQALMEDLHSDDEEKC